MSEAVPPDKGRAREQLVYLARDRALFGCMYAFGLDVSEAGLLLREQANFSTRSIYIPRLKRKIPGKKVMTSDIRRLLRAYPQTRTDDLPYLFPSRNQRPLSRKRVETLLRLYAARAGFPPPKRHSHAFGTRSPPISSILGRLWNMSRITWDMSPFAPLEYVPGSRMPSGSG